MWDLPGPGVEPVSPALTGKFLTTGLPGKPLKKKFIWLYQVLSCSMKDLQMWHANS